VSPRALVFTKARRVKPGDREEDGNVLFMGQAEGTNLHLVTTEETANQEPVIRGEV
jgi:hypothetical protein